MPILSFLPHANHKSLGYHVTRFSVICKSDYLIHWREKQRWVRETLVGCLLHAHYRGPGLQPHTWALSGNRIIILLVYKTVPNLLSHTSQDLCPYFVISVIRQSQRAPFFFVFLNWFSKERKGESDRHRFVVALIYAFIGWSMCPDRGSNPGDQTRGSTTTLVYWDVALTNWTTQPGCQRADFKQSHSTFKCFVLLEFLLWVFGSKKYFRLYISLVLSGS